MLTLIARWFRGLIAGWLMALIMILIQRAMKKAFEGAQQSHNTAPRNRPASGSVIETIWDGMSIDHLRATFGKPDKQEKAGFNREIWTYRNFDGSHNPTEIHIENGAVTHWQPAPLESIEKPKDD